MGKEAQISGKATKNPRNAMGIVNRPQAIGGFKSSYYDEGDGELSALSRGDLDELNAKVTKILKDTGIGIDNVNWMDIGSNEIDIFSRRNIAVRRQYDKQTGVMRHDLFQITNPDLRGKGVSKAIHRALVPLYEKLGVKRIDVFASLSNGGYTWAQYGFRVTRKEAELYKTEAKSHQEDVARIIDKFYASHPATARFPMKLLSSQNWGREAMAGTSWNGSIDLTNKTERNDFYSYIGYKKR